MAPDQRTKLQKYSAPALEKGLDILELLSLSSVEMSLSQIATGVGRSKNEIFRMMIVLEERGYINRTAGDFYFLTDRLSVLGSSRSGHNRLAEVAMPVLAGLTEKTALSCHLSVIEGDVVLVIAQADAAKGYTISVPVGHRSPVAGTSAGECMSAAAGDGQPSSRDRLRGGADAHRDRANDADPGAVAALTELPNPDLPGITELSAPVLDTTARRAVAAITVPYMSAMMSEAQRHEMRSDLLDAVQLMQQRITILLPQM